MLRTTRPVMMRSNGTGEICNSIGLFGVPIRMIIYYSHNIRKFGYVQFICVNLTIPSKY